MDVNGDLLIGAQSVQANGNKLYGINPASNKNLEPAFYGGDASHVDQAVQLAWSAFDQFKESSLEERATFLEQIGEEILALGDVLIERGMQETGLPRARFEGERARTVNQLRLFAEVVRQGDWLDVRIDTALPDRQPLPRPDIRLRHIPLGPVAVFGASNFPLAFSVAGGDTASALAAGCPVIVKGHSAHPGLSQLVGQAIQSAVKKCHLPEGVFSLLFGSGNEIGVALVKHPLIKAVGFTGSRSGGTALMKIAAERPEPIPVYAEMSSINPVFLMPGAMNARSEAIAEGFVTSLTMGAGQFCTNPGLVIAQEGKALDNFLSVITDRLSKAESQTMLTSGIYDAYCQDTKQLENHPDVSLLVAGKTGTAENQCQAKVYKTSAHAFLADDSLCNEVFGSSSLIVSCRSVEEFKIIAEHLEGQLTATLQLDQEDAPFAQSLLPILERKAGRILCNAYPTGVEVCHAMVHGGPFPATSDSRTTSVGSTAIKRFLRPVCYQGFPTDLLPSVIKDENPFNVRRLLNGEYQ